MVNDSSSEQDILEKSLIALVEILNRNKGKLLLSLILGGILGYSYSYTVPKKYTSRTELLPEFKSSNLDGLGSLASLAGISTGSDESDALRPDLFPNILQSSPALTVLLGKPVKSDSGKSYPTLLNFYEARNKVKISPDFIKPKKLDSLYNYKAEEAAILADLKGSIKSNFDKKSGIVTLEVEMTDPKVAAYTLINCVSYLVKYVGEYRYGKKHNDVEFVNSQLSSAKARMQKSQYALQSFRDNNRNLFLNTAKIGEQKLEEEYSLAYAIYSDLLRESEKLSIAEQEEKPIFKVLEPPVLPVGKSSPNRFFYGVSGGLLLLISTLLAILVPWKRIFSLSK